MEYALRLNPLQHSISELPEPKVIEIGDDAWLAIDSAKWKRRTLPSQFKNHDSHGMNTLTPDGLTIVEETLDSDVDGDGNVAMMRVRVMLDDTSASASSCDC